MLLAKEAAQPAGVVGRRLTAYDRPAFGVFHDITAAAQAFGDAVGVANVDRSVGIFSRLRPHFCRRGGWRGSGSAGVSTGIVAGTAVAASAPIAVPPTIASPTTSAVAAAIAAAAASAPIAVPVIAVFCLRVFDRRHRQGAVQTDCQR